MANLKADYDRADQEYKQHKENISTITEEADSVKVMILVGGRQKWLGGSSKITCIHVLLQDELSKTDQEVTKCKHHKKHYDDKRSAHLRNIHTLEAQLKNKEEDLAVREIVSIWY